MLGPAIAVGMGLLEADVLAKVLLGRLAGKVGGVVVTRVVGCGTRAAGCVVKAPVDSGEDVETSCSASNCVDREGVVVGGGGGGVVGLLDV